MYVYCLGWTKVSHLQSDCTRGTPSNPIKEWVSLFFDSNFNKKKVVHCYPCIVGPDMGCLGLLNNVTLAKFLNLLK
jgi:hypothetical protein